MKITRNPVAKAILEKILFHRRLVKNRLKNVWLSSEDFLVVESYFDGISEASRDALDVAATPSAPAIDDSKREDGKPETVGEPFEANCPKCLGIGGIISDEIAARMSLAEDVGDIPACPRCQGRGTLRVVEVVSEGGKEK